jgi:hypothetical protein
MRLRLALDEDRPLPYSTTGCAERCGLGDAKQASRVLRALERIGVLAHVGSPPVRGKPDGTKLFLPRQLARPHGSGAVEAASRGRLCGWQAADVALPRSDPGEPRPGSPLRRQRSSSRSALGTSSRSSHRIGAALAEHDPEPRARGACSALYWEPFAHGQRSRSLARSSPRAHLLDCLGPVAADANAQPVEIDIGLDGRGGRHQPQTPFWRRSARW